MLKKFFTMILKKIKKLSLIEVLIIFIIGLIVVFALFWFSRAKRLVQVDLVAKSLNSNGGPPPPYWLTNSIHEGDKIFNEFGKLVGTVKQVQNVDFGGSFRYLRASVELETILNSRTKLHSYGNQRLRIGDDLTLTIKNVKFTGVIQKIRSPGEVDDLKRKEFTVKVFMRNVPVWLLKTYDSTYKVFDEENNQIFQIVEVLTVKPSSEEIIKAEGGTVQYVESDLHRNIEMSVKLTANCEQGVCYFNQDQPIKIGSQLWAQSDKSFVSYAIITEILEEKDL